MDGRNHAAARWPRETHGSGNTERRARREGLLRCCHAYQPRRSVGCEPGRERVMTSLVEVAAQLLAPYEREAVLGDLEEAGENSWRGLLGVLGLVIRRETALWKSWHPWVAAFGLALPFSFVLMGFSLSVGWSYQNFIRLGVGFWPLISRFSLLVAWSWTGGFVVGSLSRRTLWASIAATCSPCLFCLARFRESSLPSICLLLFLVPAISGVLKGLQNTRIKR